MPQLMPLSWVFSGFMMMLLMFVVSVFYSMVWECRDVDISVGSDKNSKVLWFW